ncbi:hypothetical protein [Bartonella sp. CB74]|uniref:hypothetical protein n=1 Tax=Bartonella sp. CB74 TaxID=3113620 RepID=UPI002F96464E
MMQDWIGTLFTGFVSFIVSLSVTLVSFVVTLIVRSKDRKAAAKIRADDLARTAKNRKEDREWVTKQFIESQKQTEALKEQAESTKSLAELSQKHVEILLDNKKVQDLGIPLVVYIEKVYFPTVDNWKVLSLRIENKAETAIQLLSIKLKDDSRFILGYEIYWYEPKRPPRTTRSPYMDPIDISAFDVVPLLAFNKTQKRESIPPATWKKTKNFRTGQEINFDFSIHPHKNTSLSISVAAHKENIKERVTLLITHTSPLQPETTMTVTIQTNLMDFKKVDELI